jgi:hypothetical protein
MAVMGHFTRLPVATGCCLEIGLKNGVSACLDS